MSIKSENAKTRLFPFEKSITIAGNHYTERFYYRIIEVLYDSKDSLESVKAVVYLNIENYLTNDGGYIENEVTFSKPFDDSVLNSVDTYNMLVKLNRG